MGWSWIGAHGGGSGEPPPRREKYLTPGGLSTSRADIKVALFRDKAPIFHVKNSSTYAKGVGIFKGTPSTVHSCFMIQGGLAHRIDIAGFKRQGRSMRYI